MSIAGEVRVVVAVGDWVQVVVGTIVSVAVVCLIAVKLGGGVSVCCWVGVARTAVSVNVGGVGIHLAKDRFVVNTTGVAGVD